MSGAAARVAHTGDTPTPAQRDRPAREELLARRSRGSLLLHSGCRGLFPAGEAGAARRASHRVHPGLGHPCDCRSLPGSATSDAPTTTRRAARVRRAPAPAASLLHPDLGLCRALHARARSVFAMAARLADASRRPVRVRRSHSRRRLPPPEDRRRRRSAGLLRRHRSDRAIAGTRARIASRSRRERPTTTPYGPYHEVQVMATGPLAASLGVLARDRWRALGEKRMPALRSVCRRSLAFRCRRRISRTSTSPSPGPCRNSRRSQAIRECEALFLDSIAAATAIDLHREPVLHERHAWRRAGRAAERAERPRDRRRLAEGMPRLARAEHDGRVSRPRVPAADCRRHLQAFADRVPGRVSGAGCPDLHPFQGDGRGR